MITLTSEGVFLSMVGSFNLSFGLDGFVKIKYKTKILKNTYITKIKADTTMGRRIVGLL